MEYRDYYATLGVPRGASQAEIRKRFRKLAREHHPDVNAGNAKAEQRFKEISEAHEVLSDPAKRKAYDGLGRDWERHQRAGASAGGSGFPGGIRFEYRGDPQDLSGFSDFFRTFFAGGADGTGGASGALGGRSTGNAAAAGIDIEALLRGAAATTPGATAPGGHARGARTRGAQARSRTDVAADTEVDLAEVLTGTQRRVQVGERILEVKIPAGVEDRQRIRLSGKAGDGGHVYLTVRVRPHRQFVRSGADLTRELPITLGEALLGAEVRVPTLSGRTLLLRIPAGTQSGRLFRLAGQGLPRFRADGRGDLLVRTRVVLPSTLDEEGSRLARELVDHIGQPDPRQERAESPASARS